MRASTPVALASVFLMSLAGCPQTELAYGDFNSIILAMYPPAHRRGDAGRTLGPAKGGGYDARSARVPGREGT